MNVPNPSDPTVWGIDLGGTKIEGAVLARNDSWRPLHRLRLPTESVHGYDHVVGQVCRVVEQLEAASGLRRPARIGIGTPGVTEPSSGVLKNSNTVCLNGRPLRDDLEQRLGCKVEMANDANCFALAEATMGAAKGRPVVIGLILGTGVGSGIVVGGHVLNGLHGIAGEWGHNPICGEATPCYCGRRGCVETVFSGPALERFYRQESGQELRLPEIVRRRDAGDPVAVATIQRLLTKFGEAIAAVINILDPDAIVIGGGVGNIPDLYTEAARQEVLKHLFNGNVKTEFLKPKLGDSAGVFGAAMLCA